MSRTKNHKMASLVDAETKAKMYGTAAYMQAGQAIMDFTPINTVCAALSGQHIYADDPKRQVRAHHFCTHRHNSKIGMFHQCIIFDSNKSDARLIGIEYLVEEDVFKKLPEEEKRYWHSHKHEVESGALMLQTKSLVPNAAVDEAEQPAMLCLRKLYGKIIHSWSYDQDPDLPLGPPRLMMSLIDDSHVDPKPTAGRDEEHGYDTAAKRAFRATYIPQDGFEPDPAADSWKDGKGIRFVPTEVDVEPLKR